MTSTGYEFEREFWDRIKQHAERTKHWVESNGFEIPDDGTIGTNVFTISKGEIPDKPSWEGMMNRAFQDPHTKKPVHGISNFNDAFRMIRMYLMKRHNFYIVSQNNPNADAKYNGWGLGSERASLKHVKRMRNHQSTLLTTTIEELEAFADIGRGWEDENAKAELLDILSGIDGMRKASQQLTGESYTPSLFLWGLLNAGDEEDIENTDDEGTSDE